MLVEAERRVVTRVLLYYVDKKTNKIYGALVQRPPDSKREADKLSLFGGSNNSLLESDQLTEDHIARYNVVFHLLNELHLNINPDCLIQVFEHEALETKSGITWAETDFIYQVESMESLSDYQPHKGRKRGIDWFEMEVTQAGILFAPQRLSKIALRKIEGLHRVFDQDAIAFDQYTVIHQALIHIFAQMRDFSTI